MGGSGAHECEFEPPNAVDFNGYTTPQKQPFT